MILLDLEKILAFVRTGAHPRALCVRVATKGLIYTGPHPLTQARDERRLSGMRTVALCVLVLAVFANAGQAQVPVFEINRAESSVKFNVKASIEIAGTFEKWHASVKFWSPDLTSAILNIRIQAASVHTGSDVEDGKLKGKDDFFDAEQSPLIRFLRRR